MTQTESTVILALVRDLMFSGRIGAEARAAGATCRIVRDPAKLPPDGRLLIVDLNLPGSIDAAAAWGKAQNKPVVGFVAHTDAQIVAAARAAGLGQVMARSKFVEILPQLIRQALPT